MTGVDRRGVIGRRRSAALGVNDRFHQVQTLAKNRGVTGSRDGAEVRNPSKIRHRLVGLDPPDGTNRISDEASIG